MPDEKFLALKMQFEEQLPSHLIFIDQCWSRLTLVNWNHNKLVEMQNAVHKLAGTGGAFGYPKLTEHGKKLDTILLGIVDSRSVPDQALKEKISKLIDILKQSAGIRVQPTITKRQSAINLSGMSVLIVDDDEMLSENLKWQCEQFGCTVKTVNHLSEAIKTISNEIPDVLLMDVVFPEGSFAGIDAITEIYDEIGYKIPVVFISSREDMNARLKALRSGGSGYLSKPIDPSELLDHLKQLYDQRPKHAKILVIDDDLISSEIVSSFLELNGYLSVTSNEPVDILNLIQQHNPDILLLDLLMPKLNGDMVLQVLRQHSQYQHLPVIFVTGDNRPETIGKLSNLGASGFISKPVDEKNLIATIQNVLIKSNAIKNLVSQISQNPADERSCNRNRLFSELEKVITDNNEGGLTYSFAQFMIKNSDYIKRQVGYKALEYIDCELLKNINKFLNGRDLICRLADFNYLILLEEQSAAMHKQRYEDIFKQIQALTINYQNSNVAFQPCMGAIFIDNSTLSVDDAISKAEKLCLTNLNVETSITFEYHQIAAEERRLQQENDISQALSEKGVIPLYQPIINVERPAEVYEIYARIKPTQQDTPLITPGIFTPVIHKFNQQSLFNQALFDVLISSINQSSGLHQKTLVVKPLPTDNNLKTLLSHVKNALNGNQSTPSFIIAIEEEFVFDHPKTMKEIQETCEQLSFATLLCRAGGGNLSDAMMKDFNFKYAKLCRSLVEKVLEDESCAIQQLSELLSSGITVIAPFVENASAFAKLWGLGIRQFQGYFIAAPESKMSYEFNNQMF